MNFMNLDCLIIVFLISIAIRRFSCFSEMYFIVCGDSTDYEIMNHRNEFLGARNS